MNLQSKPYKAISSSNILMFFFFVSPMLLTFFSFPSKANAWFEVCNRSGQKQYVAFAYRDVGDGRYGGGDNGWTSEGWWNLESGQCSQIYPHELTRRGQYYYLYSVGEDGTVTSSGDRQFCTLKRRFTVRRADQRCSYKFKGFYEVDRGGNRNLTINIKD
ncbi:DUF1036 domain-containing protein [Cronbergia sp. UHCC 0137]|uniref:DUF1036 domain-containing protein n=1 Tax=Cronbergia sp. UHCC 0137 TaxID=3110239 RepID=UPI002B1EC0C3|nr:DUF1036 domain-containing protein [Cronbergia sp. UHCC 0137]MEA5618045.1 DUF1036 domain-containing protein [Cronbergia sp. UHCC 0137]